MERNQGSAEKILEEITEKFTNMSRYMNLRTLEIITINRRNLRESTSGYTIIKMKAENKENILKSVREK